MKITRGPLVEQYATTFGISVFEVMEWVCTYVNKPELATLPEPTEQERAVSIREYMTKAVENSTGGRIKASIAQAKAEMGEAA